MTYVDILAFKFNLFVNTLLIKKTRHFITFLIYRYLKRYVCEGSEIMFAPFSSWDFCEEIPELFVSRPFILLFNNSAMTRILLCIFMDVNFHIDPAVKYYWYPSVWFHIALAWEVTQLELHVDTQSDIYTHGAFPPCLLCKLKVILSDSCKTSVTSSKAGIKVEMWSISELFRFGQMRNRGVKSCQRQENFS